jgi:murein DD-endopeptidase MepM/ murein hydrolase activator NlpD
MSRTARISALVGALGLGLTGAAYGAGAGSPDVAALQVALRANKVYLGTIDGFEGPETRTAIAAFQRLVGLWPDGVAGPSTRRALGDRGSPDLGTRPLSLGQAGWDVAELQFALAWHGFPSGPLDGAFGLRTQAALLRYQRWAGLPPVGIAGPATVAALSGPVPRCQIRLVRPLRAPLGSPFGPRGNGFHSGVDLKAAVGAPVVAAAPGRVSYAGVAVGGWGNLVVVEHGQSIETFYAHLSRIDVGLGQEIAAGQPIGLVGATGDARGPHLHFEVRVRGAAVDPLPAFARETR